MSQRITISNKIPRRTQQYENEQGDRRWQRRLYEKLTGYRGELNDDLTVIMAGQASPLRQLLNLHPALAARFRAVIDFPGCTSAGPR
jgi:hypothetical protein